MNFHIFKINPDIQFKRRKKKKENKSHLPGLSSQKSLPVSKKNVSLSNWESLWKKKLSRTYFKERKSKVYKTYEILKNV